MIAMSPLTTLNNWGSSSSRVDRRNWPTPMVRSRVDRARPVPSTALRIVLNLYTKIPRPLRPTRRCQKIRGGPALAKTSKPVTTKTGRRTSKARAALIARTPTFFGSNGNSAVPPAALLSCIQQEQSRTPGVSERGVGRNAQPARADSAGPQTPAIIQSTVGIALAHDDRRNFEPVLREVVKQRLGFVRPSEDRVAEDCPPM